MLQLVERGVRRETFFQYNTSLNNHQFLYCI